MKKLLTACLFMMAVSPAMAQKLTKVTIGPIGVFEKFTIELDEHVLVNISKDGNIISWGTDHWLGQMENFDDRLDPYTGRVEYYASNDNEAFRGKIKSIGRTYFTYYASYDFEILSGKLKTIGNINFDYHQAYENEAYRGNIKNIGQSAVNWFGSTENAGLQGKLKSFGSTILNYYLSFEDKAYQGKIKSIDRNNYTYYSSLDRIDYRGALKTGAMVVFANGIKFFTRN